MVEVEFTHNWLTDYFVAVIRLHDFDRLSDRTPGVRSIMRERIRDSGASLVEVGLLLPLLLSLAIGLSEVSFLVVDYLTVSNSAREGARTGGAAANFNQGGIDADDLILSAVEESACNLTFGDLEEVRIFKADANGDPIVGSVNVYSRPRHRPAVPR